MNAGAGGDRKTGAAGNGRATCVMTPTYNERENIEILLPRILALDVPDLRVLVVDDNSPDGTGALVQDMAEALDDPDRLRVLHRASKEGYGVAYLAGLRSILDQRLGDVVVTMDADLSHAPEDVPRVAAAASDAATLAIGSRYVPGGSVTGWPLARRIESKIANFLARHAVGIRVADLTTGFRAFPAEMLCQMNMEALRRQGYGFLTLILAEAKRINARFVEVPVRFRDGLRGNSKLGSDEPIQYAANLVRIMISRSRTPTAATRHSPEQATPATRLARR